MKKKMNREKNEVKLCWTRTRKADNIYKNKMKKI